MNDVSVEFKSEFKAKLESGIEHRELIDFMRCCKVEGLGQREAYDRLHELWLEYGFQDDGHEKENQLRDDLEYVMEIAWRFCPTAARIWDGSLSRSKND